MNVISEKGLHLALLFPQKLLKLLYWLSDFNMRPVDSQPSDHHNALPIFQLNVDNAKVFNKCKKVQYIEIHHYD